MELMPDSESVWPDSVVVPCVEVMVNRLEGSAVRKVGTKLYVMCFFLLGFFLLMPVFALLPSPSKRDGAGEGGGVLPACCGAYLDCPCLDTHPSSVSGRRPCLFACPRA